MKIPRHYQQQAIDIIQGRNTYLQDACGLGKTLVSIETVKEMGNEYGTNLVICRKSAREQWREETLGQIPDAVTILPEHLRYDFANFKSWYIVSFSELTPRSLLYPIARVTWDTIIIDEAHKIRNHRTAVSKNLTKLVAGRRIALSATPIEKDGGDLWAVLKWLDPEGIPAYWEWVKDTFEVTKGHYGGFEIGDPLDYQDYKKQMSRYIIRRSKEQVAPELPERVDIEVPIKMSADQQEVYDLIDAQVDVLVEIQDVKLLITNALTLFTRLHQVGSLPSMLGFTADSAKLMWVKEFIEDHKDMRFLVFSRYRQVVEAVRELLGDYGVFTVMSGLDESARFKRGDGRILAGTIDAMSESLSLEMADAAIFIDQHWSSTQMQQAVDRIHRMNIIDKKFIYYLIDCGADRRVMKVVQGKQTEQEMLLDFVHGK